MTPTTTDPEPPSFENDVLALILINVALLVLVAYLSKPFA